MAHSIRLALAGPLRCRFGLTLIQIPEVITPSPPDIVEACYAQVVPSVDDRGNGSRFWVDSDMLLPDLAIVFNNDRGQKAIIPGNTPFMNVGDRKSSSFGSGKLFVF